MMAVRQPVIRSVFAKTACEAEEGRRRLAKARERTAQTAIASLWGVGVAAGEVDVLHIRHRGFERVDTGAI